jgi:hypothetical protein
MKIVFAILFLTLTPSLWAQSFVKSTLPINSSPVLQQATAYGSVNNSVLLVGKFSSPSQSLQDIVSIDAEGNIECLQNNNDGTFNPPIVSATGIALPLNIARKANFAGPSASPLTDSIILGNASTVAIVTMSNCGVTSIAPISTANEVVSNVVSVTDLIPDLINGHPGLLLSTTDTLYTFDLVTNVATILFEPVPPPIPGEPPFTPLTLGAEALQGGDFSLGGTVPYQFALVQIPPNARDSSSSFFLGDTSGGSLTVTTSPVDLSGVQFSRFVLTPSGMAAFSWENCPTCDEAEIFIDRITVNSQNQPSSTPITDLDLPGVPVGFAAGNFLGNGVDIAVALTVNQTVSNNIFLLNYIPGGTPQWQQSDALLNAGGPISAIDHGALASDGDFIATIVNSNVVVFGPSTISEVGAAPPEGPMITLTPTGQTGSAGTTFTYQLNETNFLTVPTLTISCPIPMATCSVNGTSLIVTTTAQTSSIPLGPISVLLIGGILMVGYRKRGRYRGFVLAGSLLMLAACGSGASPSVKPVVPPPTPPPSAMGTPSGTYTIEISATGTQASATVQLTIQ